MSTAAEIRAQAAQAARIAAELADQAAEATRAEYEASKPKMPDVGDDGSTTIVKFHRYQSGKSYGYAAVGWREGRHVRWAVTGNETRRFNWPGLLAFIGETNWNTLYVASELRYIGPPPGAEPAVAETMGRYGRVLGVDTVTPYVDH